MRKSRILLTAILAAGAILVSSCGNGNSAQSVTSVQESVTAAATQAPESETTTSTTTTTATEAVTTVTENKAPVFEGGYEAIEKEFYRDGKKIAGVLYMPNGTGDFPAVILAHGFGANMANMDGYARAFANEGIAACVFDFIGGGNDIKSDGEMTEMSVLTEAADMNIVFDGITELDGIDSSKMFLMGESQGGLVSTYVAATRPDDILGLIALYPAYSIQDDTRSRTPDPDNMPETFNVMGKTLGKIYNIDIMSFNIYEMMPDFDKKVLLIHGEADALVPVAYSERAAKTFKNAELVTIERAGHGFSGKALKEAKQLSIDFVKGLI